MRLQEIPTEVKKEQSFWLYNEKFSAWAIITILIGIMMVSVFRQIGKVTWPAFLYVIPLVFPFLSKTILQRVTVSESGVKITRLGKTLLTISDYKVGVFERRTGRRVWPYMYIAKADFEIPDSAPEKIKNCTDEFIFFALGEMVGAKVICFLNEKQRLCGENNINVKNTAILVAAKKKADILRNSMRA